MKLYAQLALTGALAVGGFLSIGCEDDRPREPATVYREPVVVYREPTVGYAYDDTYYGRGHWDGDYWAWRDRDGRYYHERREMHEQRMRGHDDQSRGGHHEEHDDREHR